MERADWMSERGYQSGLAAEKKLVAYLAKQEREQLRLEGKLDEWWTNGMLAMLSLCLAFGVIYGMGIAAAHAGAMDLVGIDGTRALKEGGAGWRTWLAGGAVSGVCAVLGGGVLALRWRLKKRRQQP